MNISVALDRLKDEEVDVIQENIASLLASIEKGLSLFVQSLSSIDAKLLLIIWVVMISPEDRRAKPYALPVQCFPYKSLTNSKPRDMIDQIVKEMKARNNYSIVCCRSCNYRRVQFL